ncbi:MAG: FAD-dependent oxidoreductase [Planctomycetota bacterium]|nr:FAD-dependent oxidoreductase [Planctomycetota bacterium]
MTYRPIWETLLDPVHRQELRPGHDGLPPRPDVLVVGGGIVGLSIALELSQRSAGQVLLVEQDELAGGASRANGGGLFAGQMRTTFPDAFRTLGLESREMYATWAEEDWADFDWRRGGSLAVPPDEFPLPLPEYAAAEQAAGRGAELITGSALRELEPALADSVEAGLYYAEDATLNPLKLAVSLTRELTRRKVRLATGVRAVRLQPATSRIDAVETTAGEIRPGQLILTTGWSAAELLSPLGIEVPLAPAKGQALASAPLAPLLGQNVMSGQLQRQLPSGHVIAGGTVEWVGPDREITTAATQAVLEIARQAIPALADVAFPHVWTGLRPHTPDAMPVIDRLPLWDNAYLAAGHFTKGVLLAPVTGRLLADWLVTDQPAAALDMFSLTRFA